MTLKVAVIGVGRMDRNHARIYSELPDVELCGVVDSQPSTAEAIAHRYRTQAYTSYPRLLDEQRPDAASIAVPTADHLEVALGVIQRGIHLLIEKPIAFSTAEGEQIIEAAQEAGVCLMVGHIERFNPAVVELKSRLAEGELGRVFQIDARRQGPFPDRIRDVGVVIDLAAHDLDLMRYITASEVVRVTAETENRIHSKYEDLLAAVVRLEEEHRVVELTARS